MQQCRCSPRLIFRAWATCVASVRLHGVGGQTVQMLQANDLHVVRGLAPDIVILEIGTNDTREGRQCDRRSGASVSERFFSSRDRRLLCHPTWH